MNVNDLRNGDRIVIVFPGIDNHERVTDVEYGTFAGWSDEGINVTVGAISCHVPWGARFYVADPVTGTAVIRDDDDEVLPTTRAEAE